MILDSVEFIDEMTIPVFQQRLRDFVEQHRGEEVQMSVYITPSYECHAYMLIGKKQELMAEPEQEKKPWCAICGSMGVHHKKGCTLAKNETIN